VVNKYEREKEKPLSSMLMKILWEKKNLIKIFFVVFSSDSKTRILVTGGGSQNEAILQVISDIFNAPVYTQVNYFNFLVGLQTFLDIKNSCKDVLPHPAYACVFHIALLFFLGWLNQSKK